MEHPIVMRDRRMGVRRDNTGQEAPEDQPSAWRLEESMAAVSIDAAEVQLHLRKDPNEGIERKSGLQGNKCAQVHCLLQLRAEGGQNRSFKPLSSTGVLGYDAFQRIVHRRRGVHLIRTGSSTLLRLLACKAAANLSLSAIPTPDADFTLRC